MSSNGSGMSQPLIKDSYREIGMDVFGKGEAKPTPTLPKPKPILEQFLDRLYRLTTSKYGRILDLFIVVEHPIEIHELVDICKIYCNKRSMRFLGVTPLFEHLNLEEIEDCKKSLVRS
jgi:hypothetical protein